MSRRTSIRPTKTSGGTGAETKGRPAQEVRRDQRGRSDPHRQSKEHGSLRNGGGPQWESRDGPTKGATNRQAYGDAQIDSSKAGRSSKLAVPYLCTLWSLVAHR